MSHRQESMKRICDEEMPLALNFSQEQIESILPVDREMLTELVSSFTIDIGKKDPAIAARFTPTKITLGSLELFTYHVTMQFPIKTRFPLENMNIIILPYKSFVAELPTVYFSVKLEKMIMEFQVDSLATPRHFRRNVRTDVTYDMNTRVFLGKRAAIDDVDTLRGFKRQKK